jgi:hypothetical protein
MSNNNPLLPIIGIDLTMPVAQNQHGMATIIQNLFYGLNEFGVELKFIVFCTSKNIHLYQKYNSKYINIIIDFPRKWIACGNKLDILHHPFNSIS